MNNHILIFAILIYYVQLCFTTKTKIECGYKQCPPTREGALNVHLISHSHMDAGWVKTYDEYYYGTRTSVSTANVQLIYHSVLSELLHDKRRKFTFSETGYFWRWWKEQRPATRATFRTLVQEGRIEFAGGGWVQNDEATLDYLQIIDQFTWGLRKLNDTLGLCGKPKAAWLIDTYGHTREQASLLAQMGYDGLFIGRVDHKERDTMVEEDRMEFMWRGSDILGKMSDIMTHTLFNLYNAPEGFCFDFLCNDEPVVDDPDSRVYNADKRVNDFIVQLERQAKYYDHDNLMVTMGGDFTYQSAANWFMNIDKLINHVNSHPANISDINIFYSTPSCYLKAIYLYGRRDKAIYTEKEDYLPYGSDSSTYWTGFYTSRPCLKYLVKRAHTFLLIVKQLTVLAQVGDSYELHLLRHAVSLVLHHDAVTGTSQQHVTNDFIRILTEAIDSCTKKVSSLLSLLTPTWGVSRRSKNGQQFVICHQLNISQCRFTETQETILLLVYNPLSVKTYHYVRLPAVALHYSIRDYNDEEIQYQLVPLPASIINLPGRTSTAIQELCFEAENIPPLGFTAFYITPVRDQLEENAYAKKISQVDDHAIDQELVPFISNEYIKVTVDKNTGLLESIQHVDGVKIELSQNFYYYSQGQQTLQSGAYSFRPLQQRPTPVTEKATYNTIKGPLIKEIRQRFSDWITQVVRLYRGEEIVEIEWVIGPVPIGNDMGKEVVTVLKTNITNNGEFYTDSNSRQMMKRTCWNETSSQLVKKPVASCYFPVASRLCLHSLNSSVGMCVLTDRPQGGTSYGEGEIELMLHRRLLTDDGFGLEESLNEEAYGVGLVVKGKHRIVFGNQGQEVEELSFWERVSLAARQWRLEPWPLLSPGDKLTRRKWQHLRNKRYSAIKLHGLPRHVHILTLEPWKGGTVLLRLENTLEAAVRGRLKSQNSEDYMARSSHITVDLRKIFLQYKIKLVRETTLAANQWLEDARQMDWSTRYVYSGSDDGILPEDSLYDTADENKPLRPTETKDSAHYSEEDQEYSRRKTPKQKFFDKNPPKMKPPTSYERYYRRKRSLKTSKFFRQLFNHSIDPTQYDYILERIKNRRNMFNDDSENKIIKYTHNVYNDNIIEFTDYLRKKRSVVNTKLTKKYKRDLTSTNNVTNITLINEGIPLNETKSNVIKETSKNKLEVTTDRHKYPAATKKNNKLNFLTRKRPLKFTTDSTGEEISTSEEDFSANLKRRSTKRKIGKPVKKNQYEDIIFDDSDDGITKSIYDMYYKSKQRKVPFKPLMRMPEENIRLGRKKSLKRNHNYQDEISTRRSARNRNKRRYKGQTADVPFFITSNSKNQRKGDDRRGKQDSDEEEASGESVPVHQQRHGPVSKGRAEDIEDYEDEDQENGAFEKSTETRRSKRTLPKEDDAPPEPTSEQEQPEAAEPDYVITLRPTQIRTFVVWFESNKKQFVI